MEYMPPPSPTGCEHSEIVTYESSTLQNTSKTEMHFSDAWSNFWAYLTSRCHRNFPLQTVIPWKQKVQIQTPPPSSGNSSILIIADSGISSAPNTRGNNCVTETDYCRK